MIISIQSFLGIGPLTPPRYLPDGMGQAASNVRAVGYDFTPMRGAGPQLLQLNQPGQLRTLYRFGQDLDDETQYWFAWDSDVDVCRGQISGDPAEWTFYTGDGVPKATTNSIALGASPPVAWRKLGIPGPQTALGAVSVAPSDAYPVIELTKAQFEGFGASFWFGVGDEGFTTYGTVLIADSSDLSAAAQTINANLSALATAEATASGLTITGASGGHGATLSVSPVDESASFASPITATADLGTAESRVYTYTWVSALDGLTMESPPAPPSEIVDVYDGGSVTLSSFYASPGDAGVVVTGIRVYRTVDSEYVFVAEIDNAATSYTDTKTVDELGELMPSTSWLPAPDELGGLINLPNGGMAGFVGRDVYFSDVYRPYAWPIEYMQAMDVPVVGLGAIDTTLVVLTKGAPYLIQGSDPSVMTVVKSSLEQSCVSKRSIVNIDGAVYYASPDGLMKISSDDAAMVTQTLFTARQWRDWFNPTSINGFAHDGQYIGFYEKEDGSNGGFIYDSYYEQFWMTTQWYAAGYVDLRNDVLYVVDEDKYLRRWGEGEKLSGHYRSKILTLPQRTTFSAAQVEADAYPLTFNLYADGQLHYSYEPQSRDPFRLPVGQHRDWEIELFSDATIYNVVLAQSMDETAQSGAASSSE